MFSCQVLFTKTWLQVVTKMILAVLKTTERKACHDDICKTLFECLRMEIHVCYVNY